MKRGMGQHLIWEACWLRAISCTYRLPRKAVSMWINNCQSQRATERSCFGWKGKGCWISVLFDDDEGPSVWGQISVGEKRLRETRFRCPGATSVIVFPSPPTITGSWSSLLSVSCSHQGPHQGMPLPNVCPPLRGHHQINKINKSNSWQDWSKDSMLTPWPISSRQKNQTQMRSHGNGGRLNHCPFMGTESKRDSEEGGGKNGNSLRTRGACRYFLNCILACWDPPGTAALSSKQKLNSCQTLHGQVHLFTTTHQEEHRWYKATDRDSLRCATKGSPSSCKSHLGYWAWLQPLGWSSQQEWYIRTSPLSFPAWISSIDNCVIQTKNLRIWWYFINLSPKLWCHLSPVNHPFSWMPKLSADAHVKRNERLKDKILPSMHTWIHFLIYFNISTPKAWSNTTDVGIDPLKIWN